MKKRKGLNKTQTEIFNLIYGAMWRVIDKTIPTNKRLRSVGFAKSREQAKKLVLKSKLSLNKVKKSDLDLFLQTKTNERQYKLPFIPIIHTDSE